MPTRRRFVLCAPLALAGCATAMHPGDGDGKPALRMQSPALHPGNGGAAVAPDALQEGDILLSSADGLNSVGVRLLTLSPVSHASLHLGGGRIAEAVGQGVRERSMPALLAEEATVVAFRHPRIAAVHQQRMRAFVAEVLGRRYNVVGVMLHAPFAVERRLCELPVVPAALRDFCVRGVGAVQLGAGRNDRFFCSQFVLEAYRQAGLPLTDADPLLLSPADLLHMREGDVPSVRIHQPLQYVGHLKFQPGAAVASGD